jgi:maltooligosyltrehalose trehalohydrolase
MLFMGEEYAEAAPFQFFTSHGDKGLIEAVRKGRREEFASFGWQGDVPDPQDELTFLRSKLNWDEREQGNHKHMLEFYRELIRLRRTLPCLAHPNKENLEIELSKGEGLIAARRWADRDEAFILLHYGAKNRSMPVTVPDGRWEKLLDSSVGWGGSATGAPGSVQGPGEQRLNLMARSVVLYHRAHTDEDFS